MSYWRNANFALIELIKDDLPVVSRSSRRDRHIIRNTQTKRRPGAVFFHAFSDEPFRKEIEEERA